MKKIVAVTVLAFFLINCKKNDTPSEPAGCTYDPCVLKAPASEIDQVQSYLTTNNITATQHCSGMFYSIETPGTGATADPCSFITVRYVGKLTNGTIFDQTQNTNTYSNYLSNLIPGWINGIPYIKAGGKIHLYIPPTLAYGSTDRKDQNGNVIIPANSIIIFEVELVGVQ